MSAAATAQPAASVPPSDPAALPPDAVEASPEPPLETGGEAAYDTLPDGRKVPELPAGAPKSVSFGVVLVAYDGAQAAPRDARSREEAKRKADDLLIEAQRDFAAAVAKGDRGSSVSLGRIPRGILEPVVEYLLFSLEKGKVHPEPIDTPRGYWLVRRND